MFKCANTIELNKLPADELYGHFIVSGEVSSQFKVLDKPNRQTYRLQFYRWDDHSPCRIETVRDTTLVDARLYTSKAEWQKAGRSRYIRA